MCHALFLSKDSDPNLPGGAAAVIVARDWWELWNSINLLILISAKPSP